MAKAKIAFLFVRFVVLTDLRLSSSLFVGLSVFSEARPRKIETDTFGEKKPAAVQKEKGSTKQAWQS